jgi:hypothetical protein
MRLMLIMLCKRCAPPLFDLNATALLQKSEIAVGTDLLQVQLLTFEASKFHAILKA